MAVYEFSSLFTFANDPRGIGPGGVAGVTIPNPIINPYMPGVSQSSHVEGGRVANTWEGNRVHPGDVEEFLMPGFRFLDSAMKNYWSDLRIPTSDAYRFIRAKISGMSRGVQIWNEDLKHGRITLPVISISRTAHKYNPNKFSPPYGYLRKRFVNRERSRVALSYRPVPYNVDYALTIWAAHKRDAEYALYQILLRFNPLAELRASDDHNIGNVQMILNDSSDDSDKDASAEQLAKVKYSVTYTAEAWLSMPEQIVPTILGHVETVNERTRSGYDRLSGPSPLYRTW